MEEEKILNVLRQACPAAVLSAEVSLGDAVAAIRAASLAEVAAFLRGAPLGMDMLLDLTCVHYPERPEAFEMVYHFLSLGTKARLRIKAGLSAENPVIASLTGTWKNASWLEREVYDMFGVRFEGHPDLRRLLLYDGFEGHPLRKEYPLRKRQPRIPLRKAETK
jgi:NADH-quinone oxidoreductase subunit C